MLSVNFRCSTGFGKAFANAGNLQWGAKMQDDLVDAVEWAVAEKIADPKRVAISGGSYGGYATLMGMTKTPELFACGVDIVGPSSLLTLIHSIPPYWKPQLDMFRIRMGDETTAAGRRFLEERSPLTYVERFAGSKPGRKPGPSPLLPSPPTPWRETGKNPSAAGCNDYDTKPIDFRRLMEKIQGFLGGEDDLANPCPPPNPTTSRL